MHTPETGRVCACLPIHVCTRVNYGSKHKYVCKKTDQESIVVEILLVELCGFGLVYVEFIGNCVDF